MFILIVSKSIIMRNNEMTKVKAVNAYYFNKIAKQMIKLD